MTDTPTAQHRLHCHLGRKLDEASFLLGFARSIIENMTGGLPPSADTIAEFKRGYDAYFRLGAGAGATAPSSGREFKSDKSK